MSLSAPRAIYGIHSVSPYDRTTGEFHGIMKVLQNSSLSFSGELVDLNGGSQKFPWASEDGVLTAEMTLAVSQYEDFMFELFLGGVATPATAEASGNVSAGANKNGATIIDATNGISAVSATGGDTGDLKFGRYVIVATGPALFDLYLASDIDMGRGTDASYLTDSLKVAASLDISSATVVVAALGLTFTKVGTPAFTTGHTATFEVRPVNSKSTLIKVGAVANQSFPEFGAIIMAQKRANGEMTEIDAFRCKASGMPIGFEANAWASAEIPCKLLYDSDRDGVFELRHVSPT